MQGGVRTKSKYQGCSLDDEDEWHEFKNGNNFIRFCFIYKNI